MQTIWVKSQHSMFSIDFWVKCTIQPIQAGMAVLINDKLRDMGKLSQES